MKAKLTIGYSSTCSNDACIKEITVRNYNHQIHDEAPNDHAGLHKGLAEGNTETYEQYLRIKPECRLLLY
jgi:hypothetical protein